MRKGSLSLSINAIVVLILAVVLMAFALPFISKMFKSTTTQFEELAGEEPAALVANGANPVTLSRNNLIMSLGDQKALRASVFNSGTTIETSSFTILCIDDVISKSKESVPDIDGGKAKEVILIIDAVALGTDICTFTNLGNSISIPVEVR